MAGHVPKFGGANEGNFTEMFTLASTGKSGGRDERGVRDSGESKVQSRGAAGGGRGGPLQGGLVKSSSADAPQIRGMQDRERESPGNPGSDTQPSQPRRAPREVSGGAARGSTRDASSKGRPGSMQPNDIGDHLPRFGAWNDDYGGDENNYTVMFSNASEARKAGGSVRDPPRGKSAASGNTDAYKSGDKKQGRFCCCF